MFKQSSFLCVISILLKSDHKSCNKYNIYYIEKKNDKNIKIDKIKIYFQLKNEHFIGSIK